MKTVKRRGEKRMDNDFKAQISGERINYIAFTDFLDQIQTGEITSHLHDNASALLTELNINPKATWDEKQLNKESLMEKLTEESGKISALTLKNTKYGKDADIKFSSGNGFTVRLKSVLNDDIILPQIFNIL
jgi:hypothetical protein